MKGEIMIEKAKGFRCEIGEHHAIDYDHFLLLWKIKSSSDGVQIDQHAGGHFSIEAAILAGMITHRTIHLLTSMAHLNLLFKNTIRQARGWRSWNVWEHVVVRRSGIRQWWGELLCSVLLPKPYVHDTCHLGARYKHPSHTSTSSHIYSDSTQPEANMIKSEWEWGSGNVLHACRLRKGKLRSHENVWDSLILVHERRNKCCVCRLVMSVVAHH
jgi:hypothetical protein